MIGLATSVQVRYSMQDDVKNSALAHKLIEGLTEPPGYITLIVIVELIWVLAFADDLTRQQVTSALRNLQSVNAFKVGRVAGVASALGSYTEGTADVAGCRCNTTFDRAPAKTVSMVLIK